MTTSRTDAIDENDAPDIIQLTSLLIQGFERVFLSTVADVTWDQFDTARMNYVEKVCIVRQHEAIRAALLLAQHGLGHLAVATSGQRAKNIYGLHTLIRSIHILPTCLLAS